MFKPTKSYPDVSDITHITGDSTFGFFNINHLRTGWLGSASSAQMSIKGTEALDAAMYGHFIDLGNSFRESQSIIFNPSMFPCIDFGRKDNINSQAALIPSFDGDDLVIGNRELDRQLTVWVDLVTEDGHMLKVNPKYAPPIEQDFLIIPAYGQKTTIELSGPRR